MYTKSAVAGIRAYKRINISLNIVYCRGSEVNAANSTSGRKARRATKSSRAASAKMAKCATVR